MQRNKNIPLSQPESSICIPRVMVAGMTSGCGKTTLTCGLLKALSKQKKLRAFKCGPDYIDPAFHTNILGVSSRNLDLFLLGEQRVKALMAKNIADASLAVVEGVMGYYDGLGGASTVSSSYELAKATNTPVVLVADAAAVSLSLAAMIRGMVQFREDSNIQGVILNRCSEHFYPRLKEAIERECGIEVLGYLPKRNDCMLESRHLGLVTASEVSNLQQKLEQLGEQIQSSIHLQRICEIAATAPNLTYPPECLGPLDEKATGKIKREPPVRIALAQDAAFQFYYPDAIELLEGLGAQIVPFSPLKDEQLPDNVDGLWLGGGYPELYAAELSRNVGMRRSVQKAVLDGLPTLAECGGFLYLHQSIIDADGLEFAMAGVIPARCFPAGRRKRFGYVELTAHRDNLLCRRGDQLPAHEFHYWESSNCGDDFTARKHLGDQQWECIHAKKNLFAGFPHLHLCSNPEMAVQWLEYCRKYQKQRRECMFCKECVG